MEYKDMTKELMEKLEWAFGCGFNVNIIDNTNKVSKEKQQVLDYIKELEHGLQIAEENKDENNIMWYTKQIKKFKEKVKEIK